MSAYAPDSVAAVGAALMVLALLAALARVLPGRAAGTAWALPPAAVLALHHLLRGETPGVRMLLLIAGVFLAMKAVVLAAAGAALPPWSWVAFTLGWPGMRPHPFVRRGAPWPARRHTRRGLAHLAAGLALVLAARVLAARTGSRWAATPVLLAGLSAILHFGLLELAVAAWRRAGFPCATLFREPWRARSLAEFWSKRWNRAFSEMVQEAIYRPARRLGRPVAVAAGFVLSGLLHEVAISLPVGGGFGGPTAYFVLHGALVLAERGRRPGALWTLGWVLAPLPLLFHPPFLRGVIWPLLG